MKSIFSNSLVLSALAVAALFTSCKQEGDTINITSKGTNTTSNVTYVVQVLDAAGLAPGGRTTGIASASLRYFDPASKKMVNFKTTSDADGIIVVPNMVPGSFSGELTLDGYASMTFVADISKGTYDSNYVATSRIYLFAKNSTLTGKVYADYDFNGTAIATVDNDVKAADLKLTYNLTKSGAKAYPMGAGPGRIVDISFITPSEGIAQGPGATTSFLLEGALATETGMVSATLSMVPQKVEVTPIKKGIFILNAGNPRNNIDVTLRPNITTELGNLLASPE